MGFVLTDEEVALFQAWRDDGYEAGDEADYEAPESAARVELPDPDIEIRPIEPLEVDLTRRDEYRCLVTDTVIEEDTWIIGEQALIDNAEIVHHLIYYTVPAEAEEALLALDAESEAPGIPCYEPPGYGFWDLPGLDSWSGWAPGYQTWYQDPASGEPISACADQGRQPGRDRGPLQLAGHHRDRDGRQHRRGSVDPLPPARPPTLC